MHDEFTRDALPESARNFSPKWAVVLGSGLGSFVEAMDVAEVVPYGDVTGLPVSGVSGHAGKFVFGKLAGSEIVAAQGRVHLYEGRTAHEVTAGVRLLASLGVGTILLTNAAGSVNPEFSPGTWMRISDHLNLTGRSPLTGVPHFIDMTEVYARTIREDFADAARECGVVMHEGVYAAVPGPQYETPAEIRMLRGMGADAVGMSTVLEAIQARALGIKVAGISCLTNWGAGMTGEALAHDEVLATGTAIGPELARMVETVLNR